ncbi:MAG: HAD family hydrolase [Thermoplasmata archaeon]
MAPPQLTRPDARDSHIRSVPTGPPITAFATDLDRTLLRPGGRPLPPGRDALQRARALGMRTLLVSGRSYADLRAIADSFGELDAIVAENGAVVEAPLGAAPQFVGRRVGGTVRRRLAGRPALHPEFGEVVASVPRAERRRVLGAIIGLRVQVVANVDRLMILPEGVSKRQGTRRALQGLGLGNGAYAAIGDAENDVDLLEGAELAGAVANARPVARRVADYVCRGRFDAGVLEFVSGPLTDRVRRSRRGISGVRRARAPRPRRTAC